MPPIVMEIDHLVPCKKVYFLHYLGKIAFHHVYASPMSRWLISVVKLRHSEKCYCSLTIDRQGVSVKEEEKKLINLETNTSYTAPSTNSLSEIELTSIKTNPESVVILNTFPIAESQSSVKSDDKRLSFSVPFNQIVEVILPTDFDKDCLSFVVNQGYNLPLMLHVCQAFDQDMIKQIRQTLTTFMSWNENPASKGCSSLLRNVRMEDMDSVRFEVMLVGKVYLKQDNPPQINVVDAAVQRFKFKEEPHAPVQMDQASPITTEVLLSERPNYRKNVSYAELKPSSKTSSRSPSPSSNSSKSSSTGNLEIGTNRTRIFQVGKQAFSLISSDQTARNVEVMFKNVTKYIKCGEILLALKQASTTNQHGPDPLLEYHMLCRRVNVPLTTAENRSCHRSVGIAVQYITETFSESEQKQIKANFDEARKQYPPRSRFENLVLIMEMIRQELEKKQNAHDIKSKEPSSASPNAVAKQINMWKDRAKKGFGLFSKETWDWMKRDSDASSSSSSSNLKRLSVNSPHQVSSSGAHSHTMMNALVSRMSMDPATSSHFGGNEQFEDTEAEDLMRKSRSSSVGPGRLNPGSKKLSMDSKLFAITSHPTAKNDISKKRSYSTPYLRRLLHILPDVQESSEESGNTSQLKPSRFSFSRLLHGGDNSPDPFSNAKKAIEMTSFKTTPYHGSEEGGNRTRVSRVNPFIPAYISEEESRHSADVSSDEDDHGITFTAKTPEKGVLQPAPKLGPVSEVELETKTSVLSPTSISERRHSAFSEVKPMLSLGQSKTPEQTTSSAQDSPGGSDEELIDDYEVELQALEEKFGSVVANETSSPSQIIPIPPETLCNRPEIRTTIHQQIFKKIGTTRSKSTIKETGSSPLNIDDFKRSDRSLTSANGIRKAWKQAIKDQIILNKIEKLTLNPTSSFSSPLAFQVLDDTYNEMAEIWEELLNSKNRTLLKIDRGLLRAAVMKSVPAHLRGKVWLFLYEQWKFRQTCCPTVNSEFTLPDVTYDSLLKELTTHQHAILIDLGRTFPTHPYFSRQLGNGQLALFNLLKAYSLMDKEVGYCQGLSFVAGVLLMNVSTPNDAFELLCHLMVDMNCRKFYLPDMAALRVAVYQLSRLLYDFHSDLFRHFEENDVSLMLFATPWFLTMFASVLSLDFTARVFDMLFLEGSSALFKTALCLLGTHKEKLMKENGFESVMMYLKTNLPHMEADQFNQVISEMFLLDIGQRLRIYEAEYRVLEEADLISDDHKTLQNYITDLEKNYANVVSAHKEVVKQNKEMLEELKVLHRQAHGLRQGLYDMGRVDQRRMLELDELKKQNEALKKGRRM